jgi:hypothetical protein
MAIRQFCMGMVHFFAAAWMAKINDKVFDNLAAVLGELSDANLNLSCISDDVKAIAAHPAFTWVASSAADHRP